MPEKTKNTMNHELYLFLLFATSLFVDSLFFTHLFFPLRRLDNISSFAVVILMQAVITGGAGRLAYRSNRNMGTIILSAVIPLALYLCFSINTWEIYRLVLEFLILLYACCRILPRAIDVLMRDPLTGLSPNQRIHLMRRILRIEIKHLNIQAPLELFSANLNPTTIGSYCEELNQVLINTAELQNDEPSTAALIQAVSHEAFHAAQAELIQEYICCRDRKAQFSPAQRRIIERYSHEFHNYIDGDERYSDYRKQLIEKHAREYAKKRWKFYSKHLGKIIRPYMHNKKRLPLLLEIVTGKSEKTSSALRRLSIAHPNAKALGVVHNARRNCNTSALQISQKD